MILLDEEEQQQVKHRSFFLGPTLRVPERVAGRSFSSLPDYQTSQEQHSVFQKLTHFPYYDRRRYHSPYKYWRPTILALIIYLGLSLVIGVPLLVLLPHRTKLQVLKVSPPPVWNALDSLANEAIVMPNNATRCNDWNTTDPQNSMYFVHQSFPPSGQFTIRSNVTLESNPPKALSGKLSVDMNPDTAAQDVYISVTMQASSDDLQNRTSVCFTDPGSDQGLSIFVPDDMEGSDSLTFDILLLFPYQASLNITELYTFLPSFSQSVGDLDEHVMFGDVVIQGAASPVTVQSVRGSSISVTSSLADIQGTFNADQSINLNTVGASIYANITLVHESTQPLSTCMTLNTGNGAIDANITLLARTTSPSEPQFPPNFGSQVKTYNGTLKLAVFQNPSSAPVPFNLQALNNLAETDVYLDSNFQGTFDAQTKLAPASVVQGNATPQEDPLGDGRVRTYVYGPISTEKTYGWVGWGPRPFHWNPDWQGNVQVLSSLAPVRLFLG